VIKGTLYEKYAREREGCEILENEFAFVSYRLIGDECFIQDLYVDKDERQMGKCRELIELLAELALGAECKSIIGNVFLNDPGANSTLKAALLIGFKVVVANPNCLTLMLSLEDS
jgi:hypothetical protein